MSKRSQCDEARFLKDVEKHEMIVIRDDGVNRHLRFKRPGTSAYYFDLITWPGHLCYTGDMGTYVFSRIEDMFGFFRMSDYDWNKNPHGLSINPGYWSEKIVATNKQGGHEEWDEEEFVRRVNEVRVGWMRRAREIGVKKDDRRALWEAVEDVMADPSEESLCVARIYEFHHRVGSESFEFMDFFDGSMTRFTFRFMWCCYALAWAINMYDKSKESKDVDDRNPKP